MQNSSIFKLINRLPKLIRRWYFNNFSLLIFAIVSTFLFIGLVFFGTSLWFSSAISLILLLSAILYYSLYFIKYQNLIDAYTPREYYYDIFRPWGITFFNILFVCCFALILITADAWLPKPLFNGVPYPEVYTEVWKLIVQAIINGGTFGLLDAFGIELCRLQSGTCKLEPGIFASIYTYIVSLTVDLAFWSSVIAELVGWIEAKHKVSILLNTDTIEPEPLNAEDIKINQEILKRIRERKIDISQHENKLVYLLKESKTKEVRDLFLLIMQTTKNMLVFKNCLNYFKRVKDKRFRGVCKRIRNYEKQRLIEEFELRQVKIQPWRGRGKKPNT